MNNKVIIYEFDDQPELGQSIEILPGIRWLRMPLPFLLGRSIQINLQHLELYLD